MDDDLWLALVGLGAVILSAITGSILNSTMNLGLTDIMWITAFGALILTAVVVVIGIGYVFADAVFGIGKFIGKL